MATQNPFSARPGDSLFATAANASAPAKTQAATFNVDQKNTVAGQLNGLIAQNSPYIQAARAGAQRQANARGLINSSMAAGAGETAAIQSALPIAQQDAQQGFEAQRFTLQGQNDFDTQYNQFQQQAYLQGRDAAFGNAAAENQFGRQFDLQTNQQGFQGTQAELDRGQQLTVLDKQQGFQGTQAGLDRNQQLALQGNELGFNREQLAQQASQAELDRVQQKFLQGQQLTFEEQQLLRQQEFQGTQAGLDRGQQIALQGNELGFSREQLAQQAQQAQLDRQQQSSLVDRELASTENRQTQQLASQERIAEKENQLRQTLLSTQIQSDRDLQTLRATLDKEMAAFNAEIADEQSLLDIGRGRTVSLQQYQLQLGNSFLQAAGDIWNNPDIAAENKGPLVEQIRAELSGMLNLASSLQSTPLFNA